MKFRELTRRSGKKATAPVQWVDWIGPGASILPEQGVLEELTRLGGRLLLRINVNGQRRTASLEWDPPPTVGEVESLLLASIGANIRDLGEREIPGHGERGSAKP